MQLHGQQNRLGALRAYLEFLMGLYLCRGARITMTLPTQTANYISSSTADIPTEQMQAATWNVQWYTLRGTQFTHLNIQLPRAYPVN